MNCQRWMFGIVGIAMVAVLGGCLGGDAAESSMGSAPLLPETISNYETGPYEVVPDWPKPLHADYTWGRTASVWAVSPDRVFVFQSGELPTLERPIGAGGVPIRPAASEGLDLDGCNCAVSLAETGREGRWERILMIFDRNGDLIDSWERHNHLFVRPHMVKTNPHDPEGHIWIVEDGAHQIHKFTSEGELVMSLGEFRVPGENDDPTHFNRPTDIAFLSNSDFVVSDGYQNTRVIKFDRDGQYLTHWGTPGTGPSQFSTPHGIAVDDNDRVYVSDRGNQRIQVFDANGGHLDTWPGIRFPLSIKMSADQYLWVNDGLAQKFMKFDLNGDLQYTWGTFGGEPGQMWGVHGFSVDDEGNLYTAEVWGGRAQKFRPRAGVSPTLLIQ
jgi:peptidylamidoglycolate lyase